MSFWKDTGELISAIKTSIQALIKSTPSTGWIRTNEIDEQFFEENFKQKMELIENWGLEKIFRTRAEKNSESDTKLEKCKVRQLDGIDFGLSSFRSSREKDVLSSMKKGMNVRLITMNPDSEFVKQREIEEKVQSGSIANSIRNLVEWAERLNVQSTKGKIQIKYYNAMTLDFYWRMDDELYIGPYLYNIISQQTLTYKFVNGGRGFDIYTNYFEALWENDNWCILP